MTAAGQEGIALVATLLVLLLLAALGAALLMVAMTETAIAGMFRWRSGALHAAEAAMERAMSDLALASDWNLVLGGAVTSGFVDGSVPGERQTAAGRLDLVEITNTLRCGKPTFCTEQEMNVATAERPWGVDNPRWQLYAYGRIADLAPPGVSDSHFYTVVWVADDASECDGNPLVDGGAAVAPCPGNRGRGVLTLLAHAYGAAGVRRVIEMTVARGSPSGLRVLSWRDVR